MSKKKDNYWTTTVLPHTRWNDIPFAEIWQYKGLVRMLVKRNYEVEYKQTILGIWWMILGPIFSSGLFSFVFGTVGGFSSDGIPYFLFYLAASILWNLFSGCVESNTTVFLANAYLYGKVYFPRMIIPLANVLFEFIRFLIRFAVCICVWLYFFSKGQVPFMGWYLLLIIPILIVTAIMGMSLGMIISSVTVKYRDLHHVTGFLMQALFYTSPVLYSASNLPAFIQKVIYINPTSSLIEAFRYAITGGGAVNWEKLLYSVIVALILFVFGLILFNQTEKSFVDIV